LEGCRCRRLCFFARRTAALGRIARVILVPGDRNNSGETFLDIFRNILTIKLISFFTDGLKSPGYFRGA